MIAPHDDCGAPGAQPVSLTVGAQPHTPRLEQPLSGAPAHTGNSHAWPAQPAAHAQTRAPSAATVHVPRSAQLRPPYDGQSSVVQSAPVQPAEHAQ